MVRVMICDGSPRGAGALRRVLEFDGDIAVTAICESAGEAIANLTQASPDLVAIDMSAPKLNGIEVIEEIMSSRPLPVLALMADVPGEGDIAAAVLAAGALDAVGKNEVELADPASPDGAAFRRRVRLLANARVIRHPRAGLRRKTSLPGSGRRASVIGFCASTGGPRILSTVLAALPAGYPIPVLVVQHIGRGFTDGLVRWLDVGARIPVRVAAEGALATSGAWVAPEGAELKLTSAGRLQLDRCPVGDQHRPSGDVLFSSIAESAGRTGVAVVLTGMGRDGARGAAALRLAGGLAIAQDEESSAVYGMPRAAAQGGVDLVLSPAEIITYLRGLSYQPLAAPRGVPGGRSPGPAERGVPGGRSPGPAERGVPGGRPPGPAERGVPGGRPPGPTELRAADGRPPGGAPS